jgi:DNA-binding response OmpR family regulator
MPHALLLESDRVVAKCIADELAKSDITVSIVANADTAVEQADKKTPDIVISELSVPGHSGSEFLYEFRTYTDWVEIPIIIFSSLKPSTDITNSKDWKLLKIHEFFYKPSVSLDTLTRSVKTALHI